MSEPIIITIPDPAAWYYHSLLLTLIAVLFPPGTSFSGRDRLTNLGVDWFKSEGAIGSATTTRTNEETTITIVPAPEYADKWQATANCVYFFVADTAERRLLMDGLSSEEMIEKYYRAHAVNPKITLKQIAAQQGKYTYSALKQAKQRYDAAGKWGAKKKQQTEE